GRRAGGGAGDARGPGGIRVIRDVAWRLFASEYNDANLETEGTGERPPSYIVTPLGAKVNRVFVVGVITDVENVGTDGQPMWRARASDPTGTFHVYAGKYQPEAAATLSKLKPPVFGATVGKSRIYSPQPGTPYTSIPPEPIAPGEPVVEAAAPAKEEPPREPDESEAKVLEIIASLDKDGKGAPWEGILENATSKGVSKDSLEESINTLLDKGLIYEPILGRMKKI